MTRSRTRRLRSLSRTPRRLPVKGWCVMTRNPAEFPFVTFIACREYRDETGNWNPRDGEPPLRTALQVNVFGRREDYLRLAEALRGFAERDVSQYGIGHEHLQGLTSVDGKVRVHLVLRVGDDVAGTGFAELFPPAGSES